MVCPRLEYAGLSHDILDKIAEAYPQREVEYARFQRPDLSEEAAATLLQQCQDRVKSRHESILMRVLSAEEQTGHGRRMKSIKDNGYLDKNVDSLARAAYDALEQGQTVSSHPTNTSSTNAS